MKLFFFHFPRKDENLLLKQQTLLETDDTNRNITEGSEYLDDAIRMKEQPLTYTEEKISVGSPEDMW